MALIQAFVAALFVGIALGQNYPCNPKNFKGIGFDAFHFRPVSILHDNGRQATLYRSEINENEYDVLDYKKGIYYTVSDDGSCMYFQADGIKNLLRRAAEDAPESSLAIDDYVNRTVYGYEYKVDDTNIKFNGLQYNGTDGRCNQIYEAVIVEGVLRAAYFHQSTEATPRGSMAVLKEAIKTVENADCTQVF